MLNQVFYVVFDDMGSWPAMNRLYCESAADIRNLAGSDWPAIPESDSGAAQDAVPQMSKTLVAYVEALLATTPYRHAADARAARLAEAQFNVIWALQYARQREVEGIPRAQALRVVGGLSSSG